MSGARGGGGLIIMWQFMVFLAPCLLYSNTDEENL